MIIGTPRPSTWPAIASPNQNLIDNIVGLSVSEPLPRGGSYYPLPTRRINGNSDVNTDGTEDFLLTDAYVDYSTGSPTARDQPLDISNRPNSKQRQRSRDRHGVKLLHGFLATIGRSDRAV